MNALPDESQCPRCGYFDISHPDVRRMLTERDQTGRLLYRAQCKCPQQDQETQARTELMWRQANLPSRGENRTLANFTVRQGTKAAYETCRRYLEGQEASVLMVSGMTGSGKSHLLEALCRASLEKGVRTRYERTVDWLNRLRHVYDYDSKEDLEDVLAWYRRFRLVALDDLGMERATDWAREQVTAFVDWAIMHRSRMIVATNLDRDMMAEHMGDRLASRLFPSNPDLDEVSLVALTANDYRRVRA